MYIHTVNTVISRTVFPVKPRACSMQCILYSYMYPIASVSSLPGYVVSAAPAHSDCVQNVFTLKTGPWVDLGNHATSHVAVMVTAMAYGNRFSRIGYYDVFRRTRQQVKLCRTLETLTVLNTQQFICCIRD